MVADEAAWAAGSKTERMFGYSIQEERAQGGEREVKYGAARRERFGKIALRCLSVGFQADGRYRFFAVVV